MSKNEVLQGKKQTKEGEEVVKQSATEDEGISVERQTEIFEKYGVSAELIAKMKNEDVSPEERKKASDHISMILGNAIIGYSVDPGDIKDVSTLAGPRFSVSINEYLPFWNLKQLLEL